MFIKENQYECLDSNESLTLKIVKIIIKIIFLIIVGYFVVHYIEQKDKEYTSIDGAKISIGKNLIPVDRLVSNNISNDFFKSSNCSEDNISDLGEQPYCSFKSDDESLYIFIKENNVLMKDDLNGKNLKICEIELNCNLEFNKNDLTISERVK